MSKSTIDIERVVREVLAELGAAPSRQLARRRRQRTASAVRPHRDCAIRAVTAT